MRKDGVWRSLSRLETIFFSKVQLIVITKSKSLSFKSRDLQRKEENSSSNNKTPHPLLWIRRWSNLWCQVPTEGLWAQWEQEVGLASLPRMSSPTPTLIQEEAIHTYFGSLSRGRFPLGQGGFWEAPLISATKEAPGAALEDIVIQQI